MKKIRLSGLLLWVVFLYACGSKQQQKNDTQPIHFDVKSFFEKEIARLDHQNPLVLKIVAKNELSEEKKLKIKNWKKELQSFIDADINKASWQKEFKTSITNETISYTTTNEKIPVKKLIVKQKGNHISYIKAIVNDSNFLYISKDTLTYYPNQFYEIKKTQKIKLFSKISYKIIGKFNY